MPGTLWAEEWQLRRRKWLDWPRKELRNAGFVVWPNMGMGAATLEWAGGLYGGRKVRLGVPRGEWMAGDLGER